MPQLDGRASARRHQPDGRITGRDPSGAAALNFHALRLGGAAKGRQIFQRALYAVGPARRYRQEGGTAEQGQEQEGAGHGSAQVAFHRLSRVLPAWTIRAIELTIIERALLSAPRSMSSAASTLSAAVGALLSLVPKETGPDRKPLVDRSNGAGDDWGNPGKGRAGCVPSRCVP